MHIQTYLQDVLDNSPVQTDTGAIGGSVSAEFMVKSEVGEDEIVFCVDATMQLIWKNSSCSSRTQLKKWRIKKYTLRCSYYRRIRKLLQIINDKFAKTLVYVADGKTVVVVVKGDREVNETKVGNAIGGVVEFNANEEVVKAVTNAEVICRTNRNKADYVLIDNK